MIERRKCEGNVEAADVPVAGKQKEGEQFAYRKVMSMPDLLNEEIKKQERKIEWPYPQNAADVKGSELDGLGNLMLSLQQICNKERTQHEKHADAKAARITKRPQPTAIRKDAIVGQHVVEEDHGEGQKTEHIQLRTVETRLRFLCLRRLQNRCCFFHRRLTKTLAHSTC
jgi:hypothetical protein